MKYKRYIDSLSDDIKNRMMECQVEQGNKADLSVFYKNPLVHIGDYNGFVWHKTIEGFDYWNDILSITVVEKWLEKNLNKLVIL